MGKWDSEADGRNVKRSTREKILVDCNNDGVDLGGGFDIWPELVHSVTTEFDCCPVAALALAGRLSLRPVKDLKKLAWLEMGIEAEESFPLAFGGAALALGCMV